MLEQRAPEFHADAVDLFLCTTCCANAYKRRNIYKDVHRVLVAGQKRAETHFNAAKNPAGWPGSHHKISILCCGGAEVAVRVTKITSGTLEEVLRVTGGVEHMIDSREVEVNDRYDTVASIARVADVKLLTQKPIATACPQDWVGALVYTR